MLPDLAVFAVHESTASIVAGATTYPACTVIYHPPRRVMASEASVGTSPGTVVDNQPRIDVRKDQVPVLPVGSTITGAMDGQASRLYRVNRIAPHDPDPQYHWAWCS